MTNPSIFIINPEIRNSSDVDFIETIGEMLSEILGEIFGEAKVASAEPPNYEELETKYTLLYGYFAGIGSQFRVNLLSISGSITVKTILPQVLKTNLAPAILGYIFMIDARTVTSEYDYTKQDLQAFYDIVGKDIPHVIAVVNTDKPTAREISTLQSEYDIPKHVKIIPCDQRNRASIKNVLMEFIHIVEATPISDKVKQTILAL